MCSFGSQWKRSAELLGRISSSWRVEMVWIHCWSCFRHGFTLFTCANINAFNTHTFKEREISVCVCEQVQHSPVQRPDNASPAALGRKHAVTPSGWGFPARFPRSVRTASGVDEPLVASSPSTATINTQRWNKSIYGSNVSITPIDFCIELYKSRRSLLINCITMLNTDFCLDEPEMNENNHYWYRDFTHHAFTQQEESSVEKSRNMQYLSSV